MTKLTRRGALQLLLASPARWLTPITEPPAFAPLTAHPLRGKLFKARITSIMIAGRVFQPIVFEELQPDEEPKAFQC